MASTYSALKIELIGTGEQSGTWGATTNVNLGDAALGEAITGSADVAFSSADVTVTLTDTNATQAARNLRLNLTGTSGGARQLILGSGCQIEKLYLVNNGLADAVTVKNTTGTGIVVPAGKSMFVFNNGTNVVDAVTHLSSLTLGAALPITSGGTGSTSTTFVNAATNVTGTLPVGNGGTGAATLAANNVILGNGTSAVQVVAPSTAGNVLTSNGTTWTSAASSSSGGATITSSGTDVTLTTSSTKVQQISMTAAGLAVILPSTAGYTASTVGTPIFTITNAGSNYFDIENSSGFVVFGVAPGESCTISLAGNTTQNQWVGDLSVNGVISSTRGIAATITTTQPAWSNPVSALRNQNIQVTGLSSTLVVAVWTNGTTGFTFAAAGSISGSTITWGTPTSISSARAYQRVAIAALSGTTALISSIDASLNAYFNGISVSGTTITVSTISAGQGVGDSYQMLLLPLTSTTALFLFGNTAAGINGRVVTYNGGTAPTFGTAVNNGSGPGPNITAVVLNSTTVLCFNSADAGSWSARVWSISGTTITLGTNLSLGTTYFPFNTSSGPPGSAIAISATEAIFAVPSQPGYLEQSTYVQKFTVSGTTITASTAWQGQAYKVLIQNGGANYLLSASDFLSTSGSTTAPAFTRYSYNTTTGVSVVGTSPFPATFTAYAYGYVTTNTAVVVGLNSANLPSGYLVYIT
jgi:hypothetical protein